MDRWIAATHFGKDLFGGHATVHEPDPISLAVLVLDIFNKGPQRGFVGGIAAQHLVSQWQALRSDDQGDDDLHAIGAFITAVTEAAIVAFCKGRIAFKIGARQIVKQYVKFYAKQGRPSAGAKTQRALLYVRPKRLNTDKEYLWPQSRSPLRADRPLPSAQTILGEGATHCPDPTVDSTPASGARAPNRCLRDCNPIEVARTHRVEVVSTAH